MENDDAKMKLLMIIVNAGFSDEAMSIVRECGASGGTIVNARGTGSAYNKTIMGINIEPEKEMILTVVPEDTAHRITDVIKDKQGTKTPANGICICMPVDSMTQINKI